MNHDVFISFDETDLEIANEINYIFKENNISSWVESRTSIKETVDAICESKFLVVIYSKNSINSLSVPTNVNYAFDAHIPIILLNIDGSRVVDDIKFYLDNENGIELYPDFEKQLIRLVKKVSDINDVRIPSKSYDFFKSLKPGWDISQYIKIIIPVAALLIILCAYILYPVGQFTTDDGVFSMKITDVSVDAKGNEYHYTVFGQSYNLPSDSNNYVMKLNFYDERDDIELSVNSTADEFKRGIIYGFDYKKDNIARLDFELVDLKGNVLSKQNYTI